MVFLSDISYCLPEHFILTFHIVARAFHYDISYGLPGYFFLTFHMVCQGISFRHFILLPGYFIVTFHNNCQGISFWHFVCCLGIVKCTDGVGGVGWCNGRCDGWSVWRNVWRSMWRSMVVWEGQFRRVSPNSYVYLKILTLSWAQLPSIILHWATSTTGNRLCKCWVLWLFWQYSGCYKVCMVAHSWCVNVALIIQSAGNGDNFTMSIQQMCFGTEFMTV